MMMMGVMSVWVGIDRVQSTLSISGSTSEVCITLCVCVS